MSFKDVYKYLQDALWGKTFLAARGANKTLFIVLRIIHIAIIEFRRNTVSLRASALTYTVILSMVPFLAMGTAVLKGLGAGDKLRDAAYTFIDQISRQEETILPEVAPPSQTGKGGKEARTFSEHLKTMTDTIFDYVDNTNFATLGAFGLVGMLLSVIFLFWNIEAAMNVIWRAEKGRPLGRKVMDYLALLILLPFAVNIGLATMAFLQNPGVLSKVHAFFPVPWVGTALLNLFIFTVIASTFTAMYRFLPNRRGPFVPAISGGIVGALGWLLSQAAYIKLQIGVAKYNAIYGSFATLPLFLMWLYAGWVVFLFGAEVSFSVYSWRRYRPEGGPVMPIERAALAVDVLSEALKDLRERRTPRIGPISQRLFVVEDQCLDVVDSLEKAGLLTTEDDESGQIFVKGFPGNIEVFEAIDAVIGKNAPDSPGGDVLKEARQGARSALKGRTFQSLIE